jgi:hypothetical protein
MFLEREGSEVGVRCPSPKRFLASFPSCGSLLIDSSDVVGASAIPHVEQCEPSPSHAPLYNPHHDIDDVLASSTASPQWVQ